MSLYFRNNRWHDPADDQWPNRLDPDRCHRCHARAAINRQLLCSACDPADPAWPKPPSSATPITMAPRWLPEPHVCPAVVREMLAGHKTLGLDGYHADGPYYMEWELAGKSHKALRTHVDEHPSLVEEVAAQLVEHHPVIPVAGHSGPTSWQLTVTLTATMGRRVPEGVLILAALIAGYPVTAGERCTHVATTLNPARRGQPAA